jgi:hypothetical protein
MPDLPRLELSASARGQRSTLLSPSLQDLETARAIPEIALTAGPLPSTPMLDVAYIALTLGFFALTLAYIRGCERLGHRQDGEERAP